MQILLSSANTVVVAAALATVGAMLEHSAIYAQRTSPGRYWNAAGGGWQACEGPGLLSSERAAGGAADPGRAALRLTNPLLRGEGCPLHPDGQEILFLLGEQPEQELSFFYTAAALSHIYRFIVSYQIESGDFPFYMPARAAFFPGTFDPFSLSHKGIVQEEIRDLGMEVYLAMNKFSWSKKAQPSLVRRQIVSMSVADEFDVYLFPHDIPVNLATPEDLDRLREVSGRELYLVG